MASTLSLSLKLLLVSSGVLCMALLLKLSVPLALHFSLHQAPLLWASFAAWLKPPYLYVVINCIIITIAASSRFHPHKHDDSSSTSASASAAVGDSEILKVSSQTVEIRPDFRAAEIVYGEQEVARPVEVEKESVAVFEDKNEVVVVSNGSLEEDRDDVEEEEEEEEEEFVISKSSWMPPKRTESVENLLLETLSPVEVKKPPVSSRFGHRKPVKASPEGGRALRRVSKPKRHETLENTWKTITEGRAMPLTRHLKKSDTWENHGRDVHVDTSHLVKKSETFKDRTNYQLPPVSPALSPAPASAGKLRKEPSLSQDELNRRVEAFIKKFNEEMRLQRQESLNQYKEMISSGKY
ncbi:hypothetical protein Tsubulata_032940 [Turnera subulata]|uniref:DUF4408 domain-containing protein n=1 Tax=Turnera subulata TaxID=218843 RepID=A0A9Q0FM12_9ROSI|nr:hypothetical protein Tsubulata_032940 [Turnera subulata]